MIPCQPPQGRAFCEGVLFQKISAEVGTPCYVYSQKLLASRCQELMEAFSGYPTLPCFAVKANGTLAILREIFSRGLGADIVSLGELQRCLKAGASPSQIIYSGVGKRTDEIEAALAAGIFAFNVESAAELELLSTLAGKRGKVAPVSLRVNPNIDARTNPKITTGLYSTKFGLAESQALALAERIRSLPSLRLVGLACHIGSQITDLAPLQEAAQRLAGIAVAWREQGHSLQLLDLGGGLGVRYLDEQPPSFKDYAVALIAAVKPTGLKLVVAPGRALVAPVGVLLTSVLALKETPTKSFLIVDAAMNDLLRPTLYDAYHRVEAVEPREGALRSFDVVGPVCESGDYLAKDRALPPLYSGDLLTLADAGAYGASMASVYNSRPRAPEVLVEGESFRVIRRRERIEELWALEEE